MLQEVGHHFPLSKITGYSFSHTRAAPCHYSKTSKNNLSSDTSTTPALIRWGRYECYKNSWPFQGSLVIPRILDHWSRILGYSKNSRPFKDAWFPRILGHSSSIGIFNPSPRVSLWLLDLSPPALVLWFAENSSSKSWVGTMVLEFHARLSEFFVPCPGEKSQWWSLSGCPIYRYVGPFWLLPLSVFTINTSWSYSVLH